MLLFTVADNKKIALLTQIVQALFTNTLDETNPSFVEYTQQYPNSPTPFIFLGDAYKKRKDYLAALTQYKRAQTMIETYAFKHPSEVDEDLVLKTFDLNNSIKELTALVESHVRSALQQKNESIDTVLPLDKDNDKEFNNEEFYN